MADSTYPVFVMVEEKRVRVGTAVKSDDGFVLQLGELTIGALPLSAAPRAEPASSSGGPDRFPPYGRSKGAPIRGASMQDLEFYANGSRRSLADPSKSRWHDKERALLAAIEAEIDRQKGGSGSGEEPPPPGDEDAPF